MENEDLLKMMDKSRYISVHVILPIVVSVGLVVNIVTFCVWVFGSKTKSMCCSIYFAANSVVDFLVFTEPMAQKDLWHIGIPETVFTCKLLLSVYDSCMHLTTCISAIITVERSLTILFPFVFKPQDMRKRSKIVLSVLVILQPFMQFIPLYYTEMDENCLFKEGFGADYTHAFTAFVIVLVPFAVIITFNVATVATLIRQRFRRHTRSGHRDHVAVFTKLTLLTGATFVLCFTPMVVLTIHELFDLQFPRSLYIMIPPIYIMWLLNSVMNPIIGIIVCKSIREDIALFMRAVGRTVRRRCTCRSAYHETLVLEGNASTRAIEDVQLTSGIVDTSAANANVATTPV